MLKAAIFDFDGTLVDTEALWSKAFTKVLAEFNKQYDPKLQKHMMSKGMLFSAAFLSKTYGLSEDLEQLDQRFSSAYKEIETQEGVTPKEGVEVFLRSLKKSGIKIAVATASSREYVEQNLARFKWSDLFDLIVSVDEVVNGKPAPDVYLEAVKRLGYEKSSCVAFEDSPNGVTSAKAADLLVVGIIDKRYNDELPGADELIESYLDLSVERLEKIIK